MNVSCGVFGVCVVDVTTIASMDPPNESGFMMLSLFSLDGEVGKGHGERKRSPLSTRGTKPSPQPSPTMTSPLTSDHHVPRPKRPTFLPLKNHAMPALSVSEASPSDKSHGEGNGSSRLERLHDSLLPFCPSTNQNAPSSSPCSSLSNSMCQIPTVATPTPATPEDGSDVTPIVTPGVTPTTATPTTVTPSTTAPATTTTTSSNTHLAPDHHQPVHRRAKHIYDDEGERLVRRVSYLKATSGDRMYSDSDLDSDSEERSLRVDGAVVAAAGILSAATPLGPLCCMDLPSPASLQSAVVRQGNLHVKLTMVDGKKAGDRSWKTVWAVVQGRALIFYKDKQHATQTPLGCEEQISLRGADVEVASDYTKRRNVMRLSTHGGSQLLLQADTQADMCAWLNTIHHNIAQDSTDGTKASINNNNVSPQSSTKSNRKNNSTLRTRSPTGQSPSTKTRKASSTDSSSSPKNKTWKGRIGRKMNWRKHTESPSTITSTPLPEGATIGVCLEDCPQSEENECVPLLVSLCVKVVEERGMQTQGIYRIPGNKAAVTHLTETINKGQNAIDLTDPRWSDVNVISSMLKQFFQKLPDPLVTIEYYPMFIEASKTEDPGQRMLELKRVIHELPDHHYETMRFLMMHLAEIVKNSEYNKMDVKNLAIVFGPTLVRSGDDNMVTMVTDMSHQCRIVETIISHAEWFFNDDECDEETLPPILAAAAASAQLVRSPMEEMGVSTHDSDLRESNATTPSSQDLLLGNINKLDGGTRGDYKKQIVSSIISAASRKGNKVKHKKPTEDHNKSADDKLEKESFEERDIDKETELRKQRTVQKQIENMVELPDPKPMSQRKISSMSLMSVQSNAQSVQSSVKDSSQNNLLLPNVDSNSERTSGVSDSSKLPNNTDDGRLFCVVKKDSVDKTNNSSVHPTTTLSSAVVSSVSSSSSSSIQQQSSQATGDSSSSTSSLLGDEVAIRSYAGLSASTQERIRRFEMETRAMLHRDMLRHRKETEKRAVERSRLEEALQRAKQDMESEDILDQLADNPTDVVRKISDYSWRLQVLNDSGSGEGPTSLSGVQWPSGSSSGSSDGANISSSQHSVQHSHPPNPSPLTPSTNANTQVSNTPSAAAPLGEQPTMGLMCDSSATNTSQSVLSQASTQRWCDLNLSSSPHSTLGSTYSSSSSGYGSLTRSSQTSSITKEADEFDGKMVELRIEEISSSDESSSASKPYSKSYSQISGATPLTTSQQQINSGNFPYELSYSSSSPSIFHSMNESSGELTPTRKIGQTCIYPETPRPPTAPPHLSRNLSNLTPRGSLGILPPVGGPTGGGGGSRPLSGRSSHTGTMGRHKDSLLHHILPTRLYHSPRPLRRGSSAENVTQTLSTKPSTTTTFLQPPSSSSFDTGKVANNGTLKRGARAAHDQQHIVPSPDIPRCSSLDSLRDPSTASHDDGSDLLSAITATFEEKMRSLQESPLSIMHSESDSDVSDTAKKDSSSRGEKFGQCRLYRDPSLHRRRSSGPRHASANNTPNTQVKDTSPNRSSSDDCNPGPVNNSENISNNKKFSEDNKRDNKVKRSDSLTKSEKTENNLKEKTEKRARELKRTDTQESLNEKKPKEMKRSDIQEKESLSKSSTNSKKSDNQDGSNVSNRRSSASSNRKANVKELKEKFEQNSPGGGSNKSSSNNFYNNANNKGGKLGMRRHRGPIKRRHTVGGTKDLAKWAWLQSGGEVSRHQKANNRVSAWERLQPLVADEKLNTDRSLETWLARERIRTSSPDLSRPQPLVLHCDIDDKENIHRRLSVQDVAVSPLYPVLESHV